MIREAQEIMGGQYRLFGGRYFLPVGINWHLDPQTGRRWPFSSSYKIDYRQSQIGDPKYIWELNRHQFLPTLGLAFFMSGEERFALRAIEIIDSWIAQNPWKMGINWTSPIETAQRLISWCWTLKLMAGWCGLTETVASKVGKSIYQQAFFISKNLSLGSSANNHLMAELAGLVTAGVVLGQPRWVAKGIRTLVEQAPRQVRTDGSGAEQSLSYLAYTLEYCVLIMLAVDESQRTHQVLDRMALGGAYLASLMGSRENPPDIGDNDSGEALRLGRGYSRYKSLLNTIAFLTGHPDLMQPDVAEDLKTSLLTDGHAVAALSTHAPKERGRSPSDSFEAGGTYILSLDSGGGCVRVFFDCGPQGMPPLYGHGHSDALGVVLEFDGKDVLVDPGTFTYYGSDFWRDYFRGTVAHNTVRIDGRDQSVFGGRFLTVRPAGAARTTWVSGSQVEGEHSGYSRLEEPAIHRRAVACHSGDRRIVISDIVESRASHRVEIFFHFDADCRLIALGTGAYLAVIGGKELRFRFDPALQVQPYYGDAGVPLGWQSKCYGQKEPSFTLAARGISNGKQSFLTEIAL